MIDLKKHNVAPSLVIIKGKYVHKVKFKYLGVVLDSTLRWEENTDAVLKKADMRLYWLRKVRSFDISMHFLQMDRLDQVLSASPSETIYQVQPSKMKAAK